MHEGHRRRLYEKLKSGGNLYEHELLEMLLFNAYPRKNTNPLAHELLNRFPSISAVLNADYEELIAVPGVGEQVALYLLCVFEQDDESQPCICAKSGNAAAEGNHAVIDERARDDSRRGAVGNESYRRRNKGFDVDAADYARGYFILSHGGYDKAEHEIDYQDIRRNLERVNERVYEIYAESRLALVLPSAGIGGMFAAVGGHGGRLGGLIGQQEVYEVSRRDCDYELDEYEGQNGLRGERISRAVCKQYDQRLVRGRKEYGYDSARPYESVFIQLCRHYRKAALRYAPDSGPDYRACTPDLLHHFSDQPARIMFQCLNQKKCRKQKRQHPQAIYKRMFNCMK